MSSPLVAYMVSTTMCATSAASVYPHLSSEHLVGLAPIVLPTVKTLGLTQAFFGLVRAFLGFNWSYLTYIFLAWQTYYVIYTFWWKAPVCYFNKADEFHFTNKIRQMSS